MNRLLTAVLLAALLASALTASASANHGSPPWTGGASVTSPLEARIGQIQTALAGRASLGHCPTPEEWVAIALAGGDDPVTLLGLVPFLSTSPTGTANFALYSPLVCLWADEFLGHPARVGQKVCQTGTHTEYRSQPRKVRYRATVRKRVRTSTGWRWKRVQVWRTRTVFQRVPVQVPDFSPCDGYEPTLISLSTVAHETAHVAGVHDEPAAECAAVQTTALVASGFGAPRAFALEIGRDFLAMYESTMNDADTYWSPNCRDGGPWDLWPSRAGWPTPTETGLARRATRMGALASVATERAGSRGDELPEGWAHVWPQTLGALERRG